MVEAGNAMLRPLCFLSVVYEHSSLRVLSACRPFFTLKSCDILSACWNARDEQPRTPQKWEVLKKTSLHGITNNG
ncbi:hypothetical protein DUNSADRAFT_7742 [Dunaliella salina]|uniref:Encoded protein n=1 Tax=Dunaliella salina TaxID=3046 RepID=A0ABQ7GKR5_DUNSA|nr:hypothetical protein DUNSADRAFT_7742 [Dunaliella salina]|eukprot:KAF5835200.1 hypothetical protein DUNSADRAFT_7742 [Dunaliella salina]